MVLCHSASLSFDCSLRPSAMTAHRGLRRSPSLVAGRRAVKASSRPPVGTRAPADVVRTSSSRTAGLHPSARTRPRTQRWGAGNGLLVAGEPELALTAQFGEVVRPCLTNTANARVFKVALPGPRMKLAGGDSAPDGSGARIAARSTVASTSGRAGSRASVDLRFVQKMRPDRRPQKQASPRGCRGSSDGARGTRTPDLRDGGR